MGEEAVRKTIYYPNEEQVAQQQDILNFYSAAMIDLDSFFNTAWPLVPIIRTDDSNIQYSAFNQWGQQLYEWDQDDPRWKFSNGYNILLNNPSLFNKDSINNWLQILKIPPLEKKQYKGSHDIYNDLMEKLKIFKNFLTI